MYYDPTGDKVPAQYVPSIDKKMDRTAYRLAKKAAKLSTDLDALKTEILKECDDLYRLMQQDANVRTGTKGNYSIHTFNKVIRIEVNIQQRIEWNDKVDLAKAKIFEYLDSQLNDQQAELKQLVHHAFETTRGNLDTKRLLGLMKLKIKSKVWNEGMELLVAAMEKDRSRRYVRIYWRDSEGKEHQLNLNFSSAEVLEEEAT